MSTQNNNSDEKHGNSNDTSEPLPNNKSLDQLKTSSTTITTSNLPNPQNSLPAFALDMNDPQPESLESTLKQLDHNHQFYISPRTRISLGNNLHLWSSSDPMSNIDSTGLPQSTLPLPSSSSSSAAALATELSSSSSSSIPIHRNSPDSINNSNSISSNSSPQSNFVKSDTLYTGRKSYRRTTNISETPSGRCTNSNMSDDENQASVCDDDEMDFLRGQDAYREQDGEDGDCEEEEEDTEDDEEVGGLLNESGYADNDPEIDERTEKKMQPFSSQAAEELLSQEMQSLDCLDDAHGNLNTNNINATANDDAHLGLSNPNLFMADNPLDLQNPDYVYSTGTFSNLSDPPFSNIHDHNTNNNNINANSLSAANDMFHPSHFHLQQQDYYQEPPNAYHTGSEDEEIEYKQPALPPRPENAIHIKISPEDMLPAPENFSMVASGIYRSSFPRADSFKFLEKIKLKSIL